MWFVVLACSSDRDLRGPVDAVVAGAGARLAWVSCAEAERAPSSVGCLYRGDPAEITKILGHYGAEAGAPPTNVSSSACVRRSTALGQRLPGSDDWYVADGVVAWHAKGATPFVGYVLGEHVCVEL